MPVRTRPVPFEMPKSILPCCQLPLQKGFSLRRSSAMPAQSQQRSWESRGFSGCTGHLRSDTWILHKCNLHWCAQSHKEFLMFCMVLKPLEHPVSGEGCHKIAGRLPYYAWICSGSVGHCTSSLCFILFSYLKPWRGILQKDRLTQTWFIIFFPLKLSVNCDENIAFPYMPWIYFSNGGNFPSFS